MSILVNGFPDFVEVGGEKYKINTDFRAWICFEDMLKINPPERRSFEILKKYYKTLPPTLSEAINALCKFYAGGILPETKASAGNKVYCYKQDAEEIFCAFYMQYHIDLENTNMHWWKFITLLKGLDENCRFMQIVRIRMTDLTCIKDKEKRRKAAELKRKYALCDIRSDEQKEKDFADKISMLF